MPLQHHYVVTDAVPEVQALTRELPVLRDPEASFYVRQEGAGLVVGPFEPAPLTWALDGIPDGFHGKLLPPDLDQIESVLVPAAARVPPFAEAGLKTVLNGPDGYTPDGRCLMGPIPGARGLHVLAGFSIFGIVYSGGGAGGWRPSGSSRASRRGTCGSSTCGASAATRARRATSRARACQVYEREYAIHFPHEELPAGRPLRMSPLYDRLLERGAVYGVRSGWERPLWFAATGRGAGRRRAQLPPHRLARGRRRASAAACATASGCSTSRASRSTSSAAPTPSAYLEGLLANRPPAEDDRIALAQVLTAQGGIACDLTVTRYEPNGYYVVSAAATETHDLDVLRRASRPGPTSPSTTSRSATPS